MEALPDGVVSVGRVAGAVYTPFASTLPHVALQSAPFGFGVWLSVVEELVFGCVTSHFRFVGVEFNSDAENCTVCAGFTPTGTVEVVGVTATRMPESRATVAVPVLPVSAVAAAVSVNVGIGLGNFESGGAVNVMTPVLSVSGLLSVP